MPSECCTVQTLVVDFRLKCVANYRMQIILECTAVQSAPFKLQLHAELSREVTDSKSYVFSFKMLFSPARTSWNIFLGQFMFQPTRLAHFCKSWQYHHNKISYSRSWWVDIDSVHDYMTMLHDTDDDDDLLVEKVLQRCCWCCWNISLLTQYCDALDSRHSQRHAAGEIFDQRATNISFGCLDQV